MCVCVCVCVWRGRGREQIVQERERPIFLPAAIQDYIALPTESLLHLISLDTPLFADTSRPFTNFRDGTSIAVDIATDQIYWTEKVESKIYRAPLSGGVPEAVISSGLVTPEAIVVDWIGRTMYWADSGTGYVEVSGLDGSGRRVLASGLEQVLALTLDLKSR